MCVELNIAMSVKIVRL